MFCWTYFTITKHVDCNIKHNKIEMIRTNTVNKNCNFITSILIISIITSIIIIYFDEKIGI